MYKTVKRVAFIGLGVMGYPMAGHLQGGGYRVTVFNRSVERARRWVEEHGGESAATPAAAAAEAEVVLTCVGNDADVEAVTLGGQGVIAGMRAGAILIDHTTASATLASSLSAACEDRGLGFLDAPVSGGQQGAENGALTIMLGGRQSTFAAVEDVLQHYAKRVRLMGGVGAGQRTKMVNQICIAGLIQSLAEGLDFARRSGLDPAAVVDVISQGAAQSWQMDNRATTMIAGEYEHGFAVDWMRKDLAIALAAARECGASLPVAALVDQFYADIQDAGGGRWDTSSLLARLTR